MQSVQGHGLPPPQELWPYQSLFSSLFWLVIRRPLWPVFLPSSTCSGTWRAPLLGVLLCNSVHQALKGASWVGSYSVVQCLRRLMAQPLYCSAANTVVWGEAMVMAPPPTHDSAVSLASMATWLFSTGISHHNLLSHTPSICLSKVNSSPHPEIAP